MPELKEIYIENHIVRERSDGDLRGWFSGINSIIFPSSVSAKIRRNGKWENCILTGRLSAEAKDFLDMLITFSDATTISSCGIKSKFLPREDTR